jgi:hypothetical protein
MGGHEDDFEDFTPMPAATAWFWFGVGVVATFAIIGVAYTVQQLFG